MWKTLTEAHVAKHHFGPAINRADGESISGFHTVAARHSCIAGKSDFCGTAEKSEPTSTIWADRSEGMAPMSTPQDIPGIPWPCNTSRDAVLNSLAASSGIFVRKSLGPLAS